MQTIIFLPVRPVSPCGPPITNFPVGFMWYLILLLKDEFESFQLYQVHSLNNPEYSDSRPPLSYILHIYLNPFINSQEEFRISNLIISLLVPLLLYFSIKEKYPFLNKNVIILLSTLVTLSPYFRTTAYWSLGENYGLIFLEYIFWVFGIAEL